MEQTSLATAPPPIPRRSRERERARRGDQSPDKAQLAPRSNAHSHSKRDRDYNDVFADWTSRDRARYAERYLKDEDEDQVGPLPPASPEVISSLITSLSAISRPVSNHFDGPSYLSPIDPANPLTLSLPASPSGGSFGVTYGAYAQPSLRDLQEEDVPLEDLPASSPVVRTSKPPSGLSPLTAPKSPRSPSARDSSGLKGLLSRRSSGGVSRPSSRGSLTSGAESIGKVSIERSSQEPLSPGAEPHGLKKQQSHDSWNKKGARHQRSLMYMSSKERLREKEVEKKRASIGAVGGNSKRLSATGGATHLDPLAAESVINEEPNGDLAAGDGEDHVGTDGGPAESLADPRLIPARDSSLRKTGTSGKRASARTSRTSKRDSEGGGGASLTIPELEEQSGGSRASRGDAAKRRPAGHREGHDLDPLRLSADRPRDKRASKPVPEAPSTDPATPAVSMFPDPDAIDDGAPSPSVAQGRRRDREASAEYRRRSGRLTPDPFGCYASEGGSTTVKAKRSSAKLKRLSGAPSPSADNATDQAAAAGSKRHSDQPHVAYERPRSADSIDDAVESYLCSPRLSQKIRHPQTGRVISFSEVGDPNGSAVFCCVGMGLTRYITAFYDELALTLRLRLITPDRPGVGDSEPYADGTTTPLSWPDDVYAICQALKITKFSILAHSAGAIYALATALRMPQHIRGRIHLLAPWIPPSQMNVFGASEKTPLPPTNAIPTSQKILRALPTPILKAANSSFMTATSSSITSSLPKQKRAKRDKKSSAAAKESRDMPKGMFHGAGENKENANHLGEDPKKYAPFPAAEENGDQKRPGESNGPTAGSPQALGTGHRHRRSNSSHQGFRRQADKEELVISKAAALASAQIANRERQELYDNRLTHAIWQLATTGANPAVDLLVCLERRHAIGFRYVDITRPVVIHHGSRDTRVPVDNVRWLGKTMRRCEVRVLEGEGHGLMASAQVMGGVLMEISREWEEWSRVTGATKREHERGRRNTIGR
ncbi:1697687d-b111-4b3b-b533-706fc03510f7 [Thermothielavioides terrestris]|uniref:1697687d-b111-4b3b-b533-706fc03510f7 n=1 Tax=Thermothielavioides terrestris TaxID=2587410 RepID=A0A446BS78_9PEZI|nr:1697687d-b111-4b3b-b533-706fc03510f7 [Thermothielavioides terrestris]